MGDPARRRLLALCCIAILAAGRRRRRAARRDDGARQRDRAPRRDRARTLPRTVEAALARGGIPREAMVAWVQEVDAARPRLAWQADKPVNPASLMKLVTTFAGLELLGPAFTWSTPVWLQGPVANGVLAGDLVIKGNGDPKLVLERMWLLMRRVAQAGVREIRGDIVMDRSAFVPGELDPADFDGEPFRPYNAGADALLLNYRAVLLTITPDPARGVATIGADPPLAGVRVDADRAARRRPVRRLARRAEGRLCRPDAGAPRRRVPGRRAARGSGRSPTPIRRATTSASSPVSGSSRAGASAASSATASRRRQRRASSCARRAWPRSCATINKLSNNVMAQQLFLTLGATQRGAGTPEAAREVLAQWLRSQVWRGRRGERGDRQRLGALARVAPERRPARPSPRRRLVERRSCRS